MADDQRAAFDLAARLAELRESGAPARAPIRWHRLQALARRAENARGAVREAFDRRLQRQVSELVQALERAPEQACCAADTSSTIRGPLGRLVDSLAPAEAARPALSSSASTPTPAASPKPAAPELKSLGLFRETWSRLSAEQRLSQAKSLVPHKPGPLNSQALVHRTLLLMRELSPQTLNLFIEHAEALMWLDDATGGSLPKR